MDEYSDVYDLTVEQYHNFALSLGVFVHNSDMCVAALDLYGEDCTQPCPTTARRIWIEAADEQVENLCNELLTRVNADEQVFSIAREVAKYGNCFSGVLQEQKPDGTPGQITQLVAAPVYAMSRIEDDEGRLIGYTVAPIEQMGNTLGMSQPSDLTQGKPTDPPWSFIHWRLLGKERIETYGTSYLWAARRSYRRLRMAEDALVIYRLKRSPDRFVFGVKGLAGMSPEDRQRVLRKIRQELRKKHSLNTGSGEVKQELDPLGVDEDIIVDEDSISVTRLTGSAQVNHVLDIEYLRKRFFGALKIPADYMGFSDAKSGFLSESPLSYQDINFARVVKRLQYSVMQGFALLCQLNLSWLGIDPRSSQAKFTIHMNPVSALDEKNRLDLERVRAETLEILQRVGQALGIESDEWHAYLLQRSGIPSYLLRKSGKEVSDIIKGKISVTERIAKVDLAESRAKTITNLLAESTKIPEAIKERFTQVVDGLIEGKRYYYTMIEGRPSIASTPVVLSLPDLFMPEAGPNVCHSSSCTSHYDRDLYPIVVEKALTEGSKKGSVVIEKAACIADWSSQAKKEEIEVAKNLMQETVAKLKEEATVTAQRQARLTAAAELYGVSVDDIILDLTEEDDDENID